MDRLAFYYNQHEQQHEQQEQPAAAADGGNLPIHGNPHNNEGIGNAVVGAAAATAAAIVTSAEEGSSTSEEENDDYASSSSTMRNNNKDDGVQENNTNDTDLLLLYGKDMDDEDEAWVYKHMRSGMEETVVTRVRKTTPRNGSINTCTTSNNNNNKSTTTETPLTTASKTLSSSSQQQQQQQQQQSSLSLQQQQQQQDGTTSASQLQYAKLLKPRTSDAVLSCPCCFTIVCMDCQQHYKYENQYRAMFVMNIGVVWDVPLVYSSPQGLIAKSNTSTSHFNHENNNTSMSGSHRHGGTSNSTGGINRIILEEEDTDNMTTHDTPNTKQQPQEEIYYSVYCSNCQTQVAALNMEDEVYHFYGCLASA